MVLQILFHEQGLWVGEFARTLSHFEIKAILWKSAYPVLLGQFLYWVKAYSKKYPPRSEFLVGKLRSALMKQSLKWYAHLRLETFVTQVSFA